MKDKTKRLELETILNQIHSNDDQYDGPFRSFSFNEISFILINDVYCYLDCVKIEFQIEHLCILGKNIHLEIKYDSISTFLMK